jgi:hypothetical protein
MSTPPRLPRLPSRPTAGGDSYVWLGVAWLILLAGGFLGLVVTLMSGINLQVLAGILAFLGLNVLGHLLLGRWVARRIAATTPPEGDEE